MDNPVEGGAGVGPRAKEMPNFLIFHLIDFDRFAIREVFATSLTGRTDKRTSRKEYGGGEGRMGQQVSLLFSAG